MEEKRRQKEEERRRREEEARLENERVAVEQARLQVEYQREQEKAVRKEVGGALGGAVGGDLCDCVPHSIQEEALRRHALLQERIFEAQQAAAEVSGAGWGRGGYVQNNGCTICCRRSRRGCTMAPLDSGRVLGGVSMTLQVGGRAAPLT